MYDEILLPTDGSEATGKAVQQALDLAATCDARLHVVSIVNQTALPAEAPRGQLVDELEAFAESAVDEVEERASEAGVDVTTAVENGTPYRAILDYADENDVDVIVIGTHGRRGIDRYLVGSVTEKVVRLSDVPVLTVRMGEDEE